MAAATSQLHNDGHHVTARLPDDDHNDDGHHGTARLHDMDGRMVSGASESSVASGEEDDGRAPVDSMTMADLLEARKKEVGRVGRVDAASVGRRSC